MNDLFRVKAIKPLDLVATLIVDLDRRVGSDMVLFDTDHDVIGTIDFIKFEVGVNLVSVFILIHVVFDVAAKFAEGRKELNDFDGRVVFFD